MTETKSKRPSTGNSLAVQWLGLHAFTAEGEGSIPGWGTRVPKAAWCRKKKKPKHNKGQKTKTRQNTQTVSNHIIFKLKKTKNKILKEAKGGKSSFPIEEQE